MLITAERDGYLLDLEIAVFIVGVKYIVLMGQINQSRFFDVLWWQFAEV